MERVDNASNYVDSLQNQARFINLLIGSSLESEVDKLTISFSQPSHHITDARATVYSTCALDAPALGVPNILINIDGLAKKYYVDILTNSDITRFVDTEEDFLTTVLTWNTKNMREIMDMHNNFYEQNHKESLKKALKLIYKISIERMEKASS